MRARFVCFGLIASFAVIVPNLGLASSQSDAELANELRRCAKIDGAKERTECLQSLAEKSLGDDVAAKRPSTVMPSRSDQVQGQQSVTATPPQDDQAQEKQPQDEKVVIVETMEKPVTGVLTDCRKSYSGAYLFYFENGQIWKQVDSRRKRFKNCDRSVTIVRDSFGYKMLIDSDDYVRVRRLK